MFDVNLLGTTIRAYYHGYNHVITIPYPSNLARLWNSSVSFHSTIYEWCANHCRGTVKVDIHRVMKMTDGGPKEWCFNEFGHDEMFAAFTYEEDITMFMLRWS